jgi:two-component system, NtrC family, response regulator AtoC
MSRPLTFFTHDAMMHAELAHHLKQFTLVELEMCQTHSRAIELVQASVAPILFIDLRPSADLEAARELLDALVQQEETVLTVIPVCQGSYPRSVSVQADLLSHRCLIYPFQPRPVSEALDFLTERHQAKEAKAVPARREISADGISFGTYTSELFSLLDHLSRVAERNVTLLLVGETGSGKTTLGRLIHEMSERRDRPFHNISCGTLPPDLIESELFGHIRGAFTGAERSKVGRFEAAGTGTLLLDEIDILGPNEQGKLLRVIETGEFEPVGSTETRTSKARLVVASNVELKPLAERRKFRSDLYYRLNTLEFRLPPLRQRPLDIIPLAMQFVNELCLEHDIQLECIDIGFLEALKKYNWPGNLRELKNHMQRAVLLSESSHRLTINDLSHEVVAAQFEVPADQVETPPEMEWSLSDRMASNERQLLEEALKANGQKRTTTAKALGLSRVGLYKKMRKHGLLDTQSTGSK